MRRLHKLIFIICLVLISVISSCQRQNVLRPISTSKAGVGYGVFVDDGYAYITNNSGVIIFNVEEPSHPKEVGRIQSGYTRSAFVMDGWAYFASEHGLVIADVSNPESPKKVSEYSTNGEAIRIFVNEPYAYIAGSRGLEIVDISEPYAPMEVSHLSGGEARGIDVYDGIVYLAVPGIGLEVIDVSDPSSPRKIRMVQDTQNAWDVHIHEGVAYVGCHANGIRILSLVQKESPELISRYFDDDGGEALGVWGDGKRLYIADNFGVEVLDVSDPYHPFEIGEYDKVNGAHDLSVNGSFVYVAEGRKGLIIFEITED
jgi:hypothetical protein